MWFSNEYLAGLFDGEGTISAYHSGTKAQVTVSLVNTNETVVRAFAEKFGGSVTSRSLPSRQTIYTWRSESAGVDRFLDEMQPWLYVKAPQAQEMRWLRELCRRPRSGRPGHRGGRFHSDETKQLIAESIARFRLLNAVGVEALNQEIERGLGETGTYSEVSVAVGLDTLFSPVERRPPTTLWMDDDD